MTTGSVAGVDAQELSQTTAREVLDAFEDIAAAAIARLGQRGQHLGALASPNRATSDASNDSMQESNARTEATCQTLLSQPAIARLVIATSRESANAFLHVDRHRITPLGYPVQLL